MVFHKLQRTESGYTITHKRPFSNTAHAFKHDTIRRVFDFAFDMTFGAKGEHRRHRSGGSLERSMGEVFANTFQGKLAECAACNLFYRIDKSVFPDFSIAGLGVWDSVDLCVNSKKIAVKSTKSFGNLLLLEQHDWDEQGRYIPNKEKKSESYDYFLLIRIQPFCEDLMRMQRWLYADIVDRDDLWEEISKHTWSYDYAGYISHQHFRYLIDNGYVISKGEVLQGGTRFDADNYYVQAGDMPLVDELVNKLQSEVIEKSTSSVEGGHNKSKRKLRWFEVIFRKWFK